MRILPTNILGRAVSLVCGLLLVTAPAFGHGPTVKLSLAKVSPPELVIRVGDTVHFQNANRSGGKLTILLKGEEPEPLGRGQGWHHTFDEPGEFPFEVSEIPGGKGLIRVVKD